MYYEFYLDQFFLEHFLTDSLLLALTAVFCRRKTSLWRLSAGGLAGAAAMTAFVCTGCLKLWPVSLAAAGIVSFAGRERRRVGPVLICLLFLTFCFGGVLEALMELAGLPLAGSAVGAACLLRLAVSRWQKKRLAEDSRVPVTVFWDGRSVKLEGLIDTGNHLTEPMTGRPVSILSAGTAKELLGDHWEMRQGCYLIPYHSIGTEQGWMRAAAVDEMRIRKNGRDIVLQKPILAVSEGYLSRKEAYQVILHPMHAEGAWEDVQQRELQKTRIPKR